MMIGDNIEFSGMLSKIIFSCNSHIERLHVENFSLKSSRPNSDSISDFIILYQKEIGEKRNGKSLEGDKECANSNC